MIGMEDVIQRYGIKKALQKTKVAVSNINTEDIDEFNHYSLEGEEKRKKRTSSVLKRNLKRAMSNQEFRDNDPCNCGGSDWYTFTDENCYNELDEVVVFGVNKKAQRVPVLNSSLVKKNKWRIDVSFKNPWPEYRLDYFEDRVSGYYIGGSVNSSENFGNRIGKNSKIYGSIDTSDMTALSGGGGAMKFWAHKANYLKHLLRATRDAKSAYDHGTAIRDIHDDLVAETIDRNLTPSEKKYLLTHKIQDSIRLVKSNDTLYSYERILPKMTYRDGAFYDIGYREINDTLVDKRQLSKLKEFINATNKKNLKLAEEKFDNGNY
ncbi:hypothetical protein [Zobellia sp. B3R18]|uniref:hypothetical protein n=1 Tax=Zobellia sp. B3R18 TaxID=2841568 RepID=UPI001C066555|nr:hypothetical protein [Zobellia sp. B3R18]MBU2976038.1 hypothetical protein [Zobellia sp. B3R18]